MIKFSISIWHHDASPGRYANGPTLFIRHASAITGQNKCWELLAQKFRLQNSPYFCVFKYTRGVKQKVWNEAENRERDYATPYRFIYWFWEKNRLFCTQKFDLFQTLRNNTQQHATGCANGRKFTSSLSLIMLYYPYSKNTETEV